MNGKGGGEAGDGVGIGVQGRAGEGVCRGARGCCKDKLVPLILEISFPPAANKSFAFWKPFEECGSEGETVGVFLSHPEKRYKSIKKNASQDCLEVESKPLSSSY